LRTASPQIGGRSGFSGGETIAYVTVDPAIAFGKIGAFTG
jgi:hypothetical protein